MPDELLELLSGFSEGQPDETAITLALVDAAEQRDGLFELLIASVKKDG